MDKKRALCSSDQSTRLEYAKNQLMKKNKEYSPSDRLHAYVLCYDCISDGFPQDNYKHGQVIHRRDRLFEHYKQHHSDSSNPPTEWLTLDNAPRSKQAKLSFTCKKIDQLSSSSSTSDNQATHTPDHLSVPCSSDEISVAKVINIQSVESDSVESEQIHTNENLEEVSTPDCSDIKDVKISIFTKIYNAIITVTKKVCEIYDIVKLIAEKHRVAKNPLMMEYGRFTTIQDKELLIDENGIHAALSACKNIMEVFTYLLFLGLDEEENKIQCEFRPETEITYYKAPFSP